MLAMEDEGGQDAKLLAVPVSKLTTLYDNIKTHEDMPALLLKQISQSLANRNNFIFTQQLFQTLVQFAFWFQRQFQAM